MKKAPAVAPQTPVLPLGWRLSFVGFVRRF
jgi:hypothetical protein